MVGVIAWGLVEAAEEEVKVMGLTLSLRDEKRSGDNLRTGEKVWREGVTEA